MPERTRPDGELVTAVKPRFAGIVADVYEPEALAGASEKQKSIATNSWASAFNPTLLLTNRIIAPDIHVASTHDTSPVAVGVALTVQKPICAHLRDVEVRGSAPRGATRSG